MIGLDYYFEHCLSFLHWPFFYTLSFSRLKTFGASKQNLFVCFFLNLKTRVYHKLVVLKSVALLTQFAYVLFVWQRLIHLRPTKIGSGYGAQGLVVLQSP